MATCKQTPQEFIKNAFTPQIAVICSSTAEQCCEKNNLTFVELLQPFCRLNSEIHYKDHNGVVTTLKYFKLSILDVNHRPPQTMLARKHLNLAVSEASQPQTELLPIRNYNLEIPVSTPWFEEWRETFLQVQYPSDHEYTKHFLACILVVSSTDTNPAETMIQLAQKLNQMYSSTPGKLPKWFSSNILKYYVIIHDVIDGNINVATAAYESIKAAYGSTNSFLLRMNSRPPGNNGVTEHVADPWSQFICSNIKSTSDSSSTSTENVYELAEEANEVKSIVMETHTYHPLSPDHEDLNVNYKLNVKDEGLSRQNGSKVHGLCLSAEDLENIKTLIMDFTRNCLMPYVERQIQMLSENISNKKGVSRSFLSATKRWFNPNKPGVSSATNNLMYASDSPELHVRKLGDLYFMFGSYSAAFQAYHLAKRDFNTDQAWLYYAGALEMAALSAFMANESNRKSHDYLEESITTYLNTCKLPQFATRATLLGSECLKNKLLYGEAALQLIRMTSEESHLRSALLLEQASYCFLKSKMVRKYAFHMVLAGHRYSKAAQKKHSLRSYKQAYQVFKGSGWNLACDHILYTIGRQANNLSSYDEAVDSFSKLLHGESKQTAQQQITFLKEYLTILDNKMRHYSDGSLPLLPLPNLDISSSLKILLQPLSPLKTPGRIPAMGSSFEDVVDHGMEQKWIKLEEMLVQEAQGSLPLLFKPMITLFNNKKLLTNTPNAIVNEPIQLSIQIFNQLQMVLNLKDVYLLWTFKTNEKEFSNESCSENNIEKFIKTHVTSTVILEVGAKADVILMLTPLHVGDLTVTGICYTLSTGNGSNETISVKGKQLINLKGKISDGSITEQPLMIKVVPPAPCLQVTFSEISTDFLCDEMQKVTVNFQNTGSVPLHKVYLASTMPRMVSNCEFHKVEDVVTDFSDIDTIQVKEKFARKNHITFVPLPNGVLKSAETTSIAIWLKAPSLKGPYSIHLLIYYENIDSKSIPRYRLVRQSWNLSVRESIEINITPLDSGNSKSVEEISIGVTATNLNKTYDSVLTELTLKNISLLSRHWTFIGNIVTPQDIILHSQEAAHILLRTRRRILQRSEYSSIPLKHEATSIASQLAYLAFAKKTEQRTINIFDDSEFDNFKENKNGVLLIQWQALIKDVKSTRNASGQSFVPIRFDRIEKHPLELEFPLVELPISLEENDKKEKQQQMELLKTQVTYNVLCPPTVKHNFERSKLCLVPVELLIHSVIEQEVIQVMVKTHNPVRISSAAGSPIFLPTPSNHFRWLGSGIIIQDIKPLSTEVLRLSVATYGPGTFDLGANIEVYCSNLDEPKVTTLQNCQIHTALIVTNGNS